MRKIIFIIPLLILSVFENNNCMYRRIFKKSYKRQNHMSKKRGPKKVRPRVRKRVIARKIKRVTEQQEKSFYKEPKPKISLAEFRRLKNGDSLSDMHGYGGCRALSIRSEQSPFIFSMMFFLLLIGQVNAIKVIPREEWPSNVHNGYPDSWSWDDSSKIFGTREKLPNDSIFGCDIGENYTVTCCSSDPARHVSFDVGGMIGDQPEVFDETDMSEAFSEVERMCKGKTQTYHIAKEAKAVLSPKLQNFNGTICTTETWEPDFTKYSGKIGYDLPTPYCTLRVWDIEKLNILPTFTETIRKLANKFRLPKIPKTFIFEDPSCVRSEAVFITGRVGDQELEAVAASYDYLQENSDVVIKSAFGHEITHLSQKNHDKKYNEVEADLGSILASQSPCLSPLFKEDGISAPVPTRKNIHAVLKLQKIYEYRYPANLARKYVIEIIYKYYKKMRALLLLTGKEWPY